MKRYKSIILLFLTILILSCEKDYLDINKDPNNPTDVPAYIMLPAAQLSPTAIFPTRIGIITGLWSQYFTQNPNSSQWKELDRFLINYSDFDGAWDELYSGGLNDLHNIKIKAKEDDKAVYFISTVMEAMTYQYLVDLWDEIPYSEACVEDYPKFDKGQDVYTSLIANLDEVLATNPDDMPANVAKYDIVFGGEIAKWRKFAKTLKLKLYLRMYETNPDTYKSNVQALLNEDLLDFNAGVLAFTDADGQRNPLNEYNFHALNTSNNLIATKTMLEYLRGNDDPRYKRYYMPVEVEGVDGWYGIPQADFENNEYKGSDKPLSRIDVRATDPVFYISEAESYFLQAEAMLRVGQNPKEMYDKGVVTSLNFYDSAEDYYLDTVLVAANYVAEGGVYEFKSSGTFDEKLEQIITQKWLALRQGVNFVEGFIERARTDYPKISDKAYGEEGYIPGQLVMPIGAASAVWPSKLPSVKGEKDNNPNAPVLVDAFGKIWWDKN